MSDSQLEHRDIAIRPRRRVRPLLCGIVAVPIVCLLAAGALRWGQGRTITGKFAAIRARGEPVTAADLDAFYLRPPADKDATRLWMTAGAKLNTVGQQASIAKLPFLDDVPAPPPPREPWKELPLAEQFLKDNAAAMRALHEAAALGGAARYPLDFSQVDWSPGHLHFIRPCGRCLALEAHVRAHRGDAAGAAQSLRTCLSLANSLENEPLIVSQLVRIPVCGIAAEQLKALLPVMQFADADLAQLEDDLLAIDFQPTLCHILLVERALAILAFEDTGRAKDSAKGPEPSAMSNGDMVVYLSIMQQYVTAASKPWPAALDDVHDVSSQNPARARSLVDPAWERLPPIGPTAEAAARGTAQCRVMALAIALERYRRANGKPPAKLDDLAPQFIKLVPLDPYTGNAFNYQLSGPDYVVYSLGGVKSPEWTDAETGALRTLLFRWPPKPTPAADEAAPGEAPLERDD